MNNYIQISLGIAALAFIGEYRLIALTFVLAAILDDRMEQYLKWKVDK